MPMDELIGLRGPLSALLRNLLWLLAFNAAYTGIFGCIPYVIGCFWYSRLSSFSGIVNTFIQRVLFFVFVMDEGLAPHLNATVILKDLDIASEKINRMLKPSDVALMTLGYLSLASSMFILKMSLKIYRHLSRVKDNSISTSDQTAVHDGDPNPFRPNIAVRDEQRMNDINAQDIEIKDLITKNA